MSIDNEKIYLKFPSILRYKLLNKEISFPAGVKFDYPNIKAYRAILRKEDDWSKVNRDDFQSYFELNKTPKGKNFRGCNNNDLKSRADFYGVSLFEDKKIVENKLSLPNPKMKMCTGEVYSGGGPHFADSRTKHICWWLFENANLDSFTIEGENND